MAKVKIQLGKTSDSILAHLAEQDLTDSIKSLTFIELADKDDFIFDVSNAKIENSIEGLATLTGDTSIGKLSVAFDLQRGTHTLPSAVFNDFTVELEVELQNLNRR